MWKVERGNFLRFLCLCLSCVWDKRVEWKHTKKIILHSSVSLLSFIKIYRKNSIIIQKNSKRGTFFCLFWNQNLTYRSFMCVTHLHSVTITRPSISKPTQGIWTNIICDLQKSQILFALIKCLKSLGFALMVFSKLPLSLTLSSCWSGHVLSSLQWQGHKAQWLLVVKTFLKGSCRVITINKSQPD